MNALEYLSESNHIVIWSFWFIIGWIIPWNRKLLLSRYMFTISLVVYHKFIIYSQLRFNRVFQTEICKILYLNCWGLFSNIRIIITTTKKNSFTHSDIVYRHTSAGIRKKLENLPNIRLPRCRKKIASLATSWNC